VTQQRLPCPAAALVRRDVQVLEVQAVAAQPRGITEEKHRITDGHAITQTDQSMGSGALAEQAALNVRHAGDDFVAGLFVIGKFSDEGKDLRRIAGLRRTNLDRHERAL
jgi:hypothetical protein